MSATWFWLGKNQKPAACQSRDQKDVERINGSAGSRFPNNWTKGLDNQYLRKSQVPQWETLFLSGQRCRLSSEILKVDLRPSLVKNERIRSAKAAEDRQRRKDASWQSFRQNRRQSGRWTWNDKTKWAAAAAGWSSWQSGAYGYSEDSSAQADESIETFTIFEKLVILSIVLFMLSVCHYRCCLNRHPDSQ